MKSIQNCHLYTFVDTAYLHGRKPQDVASALCEGESDIIQLRAKTIPVDQVTRMAEAIAPITQAAGVPLVINDYPAVAAAVGAQVVHLGQEDFFDCGFVARADVPALSASTLLGLSSHAPEQAQRAVAAGADYVAVGPIYATGTKPGRQPVTVDYVRWAATNLRVPWYAIGGINLKTVNAVLEAGASRICVVSAILDAPDIADACREFKKRLRGR